MSAARGADAAAPAESRAGTTRTPALVTLPFPRAVERFPTLRQSLLGSFDLCRLEALFEAEGRYIGGLDDPDRIQWDSHEQARGTIAHRWAERLLGLLSDLGQDALKDEAECPSCGARPNSEREEGDEGPDYLEGNACPRCGSGLVRKPLTDAALDLLCDVLRQADLDEIRNVVTVPQEEIKTLEWVVCKFAREQSFKIANLLSVEETLEAEIEYPNPEGGVVRRRITGKPDAIFVEQDGEDIHATVLDWKWTWGIPGATTISKEGYWQQRVYAFLVMRCYPRITKVTLREVYPYFSAGESGTENHREATLTREKLPLLERQVAVVAENFDRTWEAYEVARELTAEWDGEPEMREELGQQLAAARKRLRALSKPSPGHPQCNYCPRPHHCPIVSDVRVHGTIDSPEAASKVAAELVVINRSKKYREDALRGYLTAEHGSRPTAEARVSTEDLRVYKDEPPGLPEGVPVAAAKGRKHYAMVQSTRTASPKREQVEEMVAAAARGVPVDLDEYYRPASSSTLRLVEPAVPTDAAQETSPLVEEALARSMERLEEARRT